MEILVSVLIIGILPAYIAYKKGRNFFGWWLYGTCLFIVALPHSILIKGYESTEGMRKCPQCAELIKEEAIVCRFCGYGKPTINNSSSDASMFEEWKKHKQNENLNELYKDLKENQITISPIIDIPKPIESETKEDNQFYISPIAKVIFFGILIIALFRYEYIGQQAKVAWKYIDEKTNLTKDPDGFNETSFDDREAEVKYIREYATYKFGLFTDKYFTDYFKNLGSYRSKEEIETSKKSARPIADLIVKMYMTEPLMKEVVRQNLSIMKVKEMLNNPEVQKKFNYVIKNNQRKNINESESENYPIKETVYETGVVDSVAVDPNLTEDKDGILNEENLMNTNP